MNQAVASATLVLRSTPDNEDTNRSGTYTSAKNATTTPADGGDGGTWPRHGVTVNADFMPWL